MSHFESLSLIAACLALFVSLVTLNWQRQLQKEANELQRATAELSRKQLLLIERQEEASGRTNVSLSIQQLEVGYRLVVKNVGQVDAYDVNVLAVGDASEKLSLLEHEVRTKLPVPKLRPSEEVKLTVAIYMESPEVYLVSARWKNQNGTTSEEEFTLGT
jgi:hypothetical protein